MRFRSIAVVTLLSLGAVGSAQAQAAAADPQCVGANILVRDACQQTIDLFQYMAPQLGLAITGGNATLAQGGTLGGLPHWTVGVRVNLMAGHVPELQTPSPTGIQQRANAPVSNQFLGLPAVDASIGIFKGLPLALSNVGGVDLLLSAAYVPTINADDIKVTPETNLKIGYGVRVGLLQESLVVPGLSFTYLIRDLPKTTIVGTLPGNTGTLTVQDLDLKTKAWRVTASKSLILFTLALGAGQDMYDVSTGITSQVGTTTAGPFTAKQEATRTNYFADLSMNILLLKLVGEIGMTSGGDIKTHSTYATPADQSRIYGSVGARIGF